jgi:hypothetical protein
MLKPTGNPPFGHEIRPLMERELKATRLNTADGTARCRRGDCESDAVFFTNWKSNGEGDIHNHGLESCAVHGSEFAKYHGLELPA